MTRDEVIQAIKRAAGEEGIDENLYLAICTIESGLEATVVRYEPGYKYTHKVNEWGLQFKISGVTEEALQKFSYGASQIMGAVMREYGYRETLATWAQDLEAPIRYGAKHLKRYLMKYDTMEKAVASYNAGSPRVTPGGMFVNQRYVDKVMGEYRKLTAV